jgi:arylsulfatase A-like enzyme
MQLMDVTPTVLQLFGLDIPADLQGHALFSRPSVIHSP